MDGKKFKVFWKLNQTRDKEVVYDPSDNQVGLVDFDGKGNYSSPKFVWDKTVAPTALAFLDSSKKKYNKVSRESIYLRKIKLFFK